MIWPEGSFTKLEFKLEKNVVHSGSPIDLAKTKMFCIVIIKVLHSVPPGTWTMEDGFWWWKMCKLQSIYFPFSCNYVWTLVFMLKFLCMYKSASMLNVRLVICLLIYNIYVRVWVDCKCASIVTRKRLFMCFYCEHVWICLWICVPAAFLCMWSLLSLFVLFVTQLYFFLHVSRPEFQN